MASPVSDRQAFSVECLESEVAVGSFEGRPVSAAPESKPWYSLIIDFFKEIGQRIASFFDFSAEKKGDDSSLSNRLQIIPLDERMRLDNWQESQMAESQRNQAEIDVLWKAYQLNPNGAQADIQRLQASERKLTADLRIANQEKNQALEALTKNEETINRVTVNFRLLEEKIGILHNQYTILSADHTLLLTLIKANNDLHTQYHEQSKMQQQLNELENKKGFII